MADLSTVRVLAVDDSAPWRSFVTAHLGKMPVQVVGTAVDGLEAIQTARALQPNVVIMDIRMPKLNGLAATREICRVVPSARVLIASNEMDPDIVQAALAAGACGYVLKRTIAADLLPAIAAVADGKLFIGRGLSGGERDDLRRDVVACQ